ncbi:helix-turn-helix transcriptional regulator [bacterium]|nr:helix-turn-helix transcriptional regulator [bacterium]
MMNKRILTKREKDILALKIKGLGDKEIAKVLSISYSTVRTHLDKARYKYNCPTTLMLILRAKSELRAS